jgi:hypothetical protein
MTSQINKFKIGDRIIRFDRFGTIVDLFEGTKKENYWVEVLFDKTVYDDKAWLSTEHIESIQLLFREKVKVKIINIQI